MEFIYTLAFIKRNNEILMMNRLKQPWKGMWNGIGGKRHRNETPLDCILREIKEETGININLDQIKDKGLCTWNKDFTAQDSGLHLFLVNLDNDFTYQTPVATDEGIIEWKSIEWLVDKDNLGVSYNIPYFLENVCFNEKRYHYHCTFDGNILAKVEVEEI
ncbi:8-oxo-dGTP diphosphatase [Acholeplasma hippikon]|uniref:8-oxo-dGTP diphosphatase n=2 Tax=Acholeplasma hippikon TaxID=264636 RepID=A0A449BJA6_9MOLU|nr:8-oxo-dGTP diphosphatase [Acholeplasma hippikon]